MTFSIFTPTRDSSPYILTFLNAYRQLGIEPLYVVDDRSSDQTANILKENGARVVLFRPSSDFVEAGMIEFGASQCEAEWVLRIDDDEFPSRELIEAIPSMTDGTRNDAFFIPRRDLFWHGDDIYQARPRRSLEMGPDHPGAQLRLFRKNAVEYTEKVHTAGFKEPRFFGLTGKDQTLFHFDRLLRSPRERLAKLERYRDIQNYPAYQLADEYLPELFDLTHHGAIKPDLTQVLDILNNLPRCDRTLPDLSASTKAEMREAVRKFGESRSRRRRVNDADTLISQGFRLPPGLLLEIAKTLSTIGLTRHGVGLWNFAQDYALLLRERKAGQADATLVEERS